MKRIKSKKFPASPPSPQQDQQPGFALIATISVMVLMVMIALAMLSLSTIELRSSGNTRHQQEAQANARMALMIAIGELQKYAGPDQRVTATASILDTDPATAQIDGVANSHWVGVWRTDGLTGEAENSKLIEFTTGSMTDRRSSGYDRKAQAETWLVSGLSQDPLIASSDPITIFGTAANILNEDKVVVNKVKVEDRGNYAYWVSDDGVKAKLNLSKEESIGAPDIAKADTYHQVLSPDTFGLGKMFSNYKNLPQNDLKKLVSKSELSLADLGTPVVGTDLTEAAQLLSHDLTVSSYSVLADTLNAGLKRNLTAYIESAGSVPSLGNFPQITDNTPILEGATERNTIGPKFGAIRDWYNLRKLTSGPRSARKIDMTFPNLTTDGVADVANFTKQPVQPVLIDATYQTAHSYDKVTRELYELIYPRAVIWNPYNVKLTTPKMYVVMEYMVNDHPRLYYQYPDPDNAGQFKEGSRDLSINYNFNYEWKYRMAFYIPPTTFEPGECLHFTTAETSSMLSSKARRFQRYPEGLDGNELSAASDPADQYCFYRKVRERNGKSNTFMKLPLGVKMNTLDLRYDGGIIWKGDQPTQSVYLYAAKNTTKNPTMSDMGQADFPAVQKYYLDNYSRGNNGRWLPGYNKPQFPLAIDELLSANQPPDSLVGYGMRWKQFYESYSNRVYGAALKEPWYISPIVHHNVRARHIHRWQNDNMFGMWYTGANTGSGAEDNTSGARAHLYSYGPIGQTRQFPEWSDVINSLELKDGKYRTGPFFDADSSNAISVYPLFDIPDKELGVHSLGALQHVQFSPQVWHPSYVIGNGFASPYVDPKATSDSYAEERDVWLTKLSTLPPGRNNQVHRLHEAGNNPLIYDISYETNYHIWDKFFLTSLPHSTTATGWDNGKWDREQSFPNSRMVVRQGVIDAYQYTNLTDFYRAALYLMVDGGFNINSTSQRAWEAFLRSFNGMKLPSRNGSSYSANPFSRFLISESGASEATTATDSEMWAGYRDLSDSDISILAEKIVIQVKKRAPFISIGDFVNRRLGSPDGSDDELQFFGTLQAAINDSEINNGLDSADSSFDPDQFVLPNAQEAADNYRYGADGWGGPARHPIAQQYQSFEYQSGTGSDTYRLSEAIGASGYLSQSDILQQVGSVMTARSDTFTIRTYGDSTDSKGNVLAHAWCEATVQRIPDPINPDSTVDDLNPISGTTNDFGRKFVIISFRWLSPNEI